MPPNSIITVPLYMYIHVTRHRTQSFTPEPFTCHHHHHTYNQSYILYNVFTSNYLYHYSWVLIPSTRLAHFHTHTHTQQSHSPLTTISIEDEHTPDAQTISHPSCCCSGRTCGACTAATRRSFDLQTYVGHSLRFTSIRTSLLLTTKKDTNLEKDQKEAPVFTIFT